ncbi:MAG: hypothetical protein ACRC80_10665, partial [Waterburya sp.]
MTQVKHKYQVDEILYLPVDNNCKSFTKYRILKVARKYITVQHIDTPSRTYKTEIFELWDLPCLKT